MPTTDENPFAGLNVVLPEDLRAKREYEARTRIDKAFSGATGYWVKEASEYGLNLRDRLNEVRGFVSPEDRRAAYTKGIMQNAAQAAERKIQFDGMDPMDAQESAVSQAMADLMHEGDYAGAQSLLPSLNKIRSYKAEMGKLKADTYQSQMAGYKDESTGDTTYAKSPYEIRKLIEEAGYSKAGQTERYANAYEAERHGKYWDRMPADGAGAGGQKLAITPSEQGKFRESVSATRGVITKLRDLSNIMETSPATPGMAAAGVTTVGQYFTGAANYFKGAGMSFGGYQSLSSDPRSAVGSNGKDTSEKALVDSHSKEIWASYQAAGGQNSLGMDVVQYKSLIIDAAYALARANDPGGRLSDNDFNFALQTLGAVQNPEQAKGAFAALAERAYESLNFKRQNYGDQAVAFAPGLTMLDEEYKSFKDQFGGSSFRGEALEARRGGRGGSGSSGAYQAPALSAAGRAYIDSFKEPK